MRRRDLGKGLVASVWGGLRPSGAQPRHPPGLVLLTPQDAAVLRLSDAEWRPSRRPESRRSRGIALGPRIVFQLPPVREIPEGPTLEAITPMSLLVVFEERGAAVDMPSLRVQARKGLFAKS